MKKILVLTDFSACANTATEAAIEIAKKIGAEIQFLHCTDVPADWLKMVDEKQAFYEDVKEKVNNINQQLNALVKQSEEQKVNARHSVGYNTDSTHLNDYLEQHGIDLVVMGSEGAHGLKELFSGSQSQQVIRHSDVPVMIIKDELDLDQMRIVFVSDFEPEMMTPFEKVVNLAKLFDAQIYLVYVDIGEFGTHTWQVERHMQDFVKKAGDLFASTFVVHDNNVEDGIAKYCEKKEGAVIAMATHGRTGLPRFFAGSLTEQVANHLDIPVISLHI